MSSAAKSVMFFLRQQENPKADIQGQNREKSLQGVRAAHMSPEIAPRVARGNGEACDEPRTR